MEHGFWSERWSEGRIGFHRSAPSPELVAHADHLALDDARVLVPLCGKSVDLAWLAREAREVVGVEFVRSAAEQFFAELGVEPTVHADGDAVVLSHDNIAIRVQDIFDLTAERAGFDAVWDRAAIIALPPAVRARYANHLVTLMRSGARALVVTLDYPQEAMPGPPFSVGDYEMMELFSPTATPERTIRPHRLDRRVVDERRPPSLGSDLSVFSSTWLITRD